jgi:hypothetical protein
MRRREIAVIPRGAPKARRRGVAIVPTEGSPLYRDDGDSSLRSE